MNNLNPFVMPVLASVLAVVLAGEILLPGSTVLPPRRILEIPAASRDAVADEAAGQWGETILARPLFNPDRRPVSTASADTGTDLPRLSAIIISGGTRAAIFSADGQKSQVVAAGSTIDGYQLTHIAPNSVELLGPRGTLTMRPQFISTPSVGSPAAQGSIPPTSSAINSSSINDENPN